jgi:hypothetical protein
METIWRETNSKLIKAMENIEEKKGYLAYSKKVEGDAKLEFGLGLMGAAYLGARVFVGPEIVDNIVNNFDSFLSIIDMTMTFVTFSCGIMGGLNYKSKYEERKKYEKDLKGAIFEYKKLMEAEYPRERRALKNQNK